MRPDRIAINLILIIVSCAADHAAYGQTAPRPPSAVTVVDRPNDVGNTVDVTWTLSPDDNADVTPRLVTQYDVYRWSSDGAEFEKVGDQPPGTNAFADSNAVRNTEYLYRVVAVGLGELESAPADAAAVVVPRMELFRHDRTWFGIIVFIICSTVAVFIVISTLR